MSVEGSAKPLRFGVVGCGALATLHQVPTLKRFPSVDLVAVVDRDREWAAKVARRFGVPESYDDFNALIGRVDAALIATPNTTHATIACGLLEHGIHVLCEKPIATTRAEVECMFEASARGGGRLMAAHCARFSPNLAMLKEVVSAGWLGTLHEMSAGLGGSYEISEHRTHFRKQKQLSGGGVLVDLGIHLIDLAIWLAGEAPVAVAYDGASAPGWEVETDAEVVLQFAGAGRATLSSSFSHMLENTFVVRGSEGWASAHLYGTARLTLFSERARVCQKSGLQHLVLSDVVNYEPQLAHFCDAVRSGEEFLTRPAEILAGVDIIERCYQRQNRDEA